MELLRQGEGLPEYRGDAGSVQLVVPAEVNADFARFLREEKWEERALDLDDLIVLHGMTRRGSLSTRGAGEMLQPPWREAQPKLAALRERGYLIPAAPGRRAPYRLAPGPARHLNVQLRSEDRNRVDAEELQLRLLQILRERGRIANAEVRAISGYSRAQARDFMTALRAAGHVALIGRGRAAHYVPAGGGDGSRSWPLPGVRPPAPAPAAHARMTGSAPAQNHAARRMDASDARQGRHRRRGCGGGPATAEFLARADRTPAAVKQLAHQAPARPAPRAWRPGSGGA